MALVDFRKQVEYHCVHCAACRTAYGPMIPICPPGETFGFASYFASGRYHIARGLMDGALTISDQLLKTVYSCTLCGACDQQCYQLTGFKPTDVSLELKRDLVEKGHVLPQVARMLRNVEAVGNPYKELPKDRGKWAEGTKISQYEGQEYLYYIGCVGSYAPIGQKAARALGDVLLEGGLSFGILGPREICDGNEVNMLGERRMFDMLVEKNTKVFSDLGVSKIICLSPHSYNAFKNYYQNKFEVFHYTEILRDLIKKGRLNVARGLNAKVTYHDPCLLGRRNGVYEAPREILNAIGGIEIVEMEGNRENAFCCGGGGGNFYIDVFSGRKRTPARIRARQAYETGASILAVACPICSVMLSDAIKSEDLDEKLVIKDVSEIVRDSLLLGGPKGQKGIDKHRATH